MSIIILTPIPHSGGRAMTAGNKRQEFATKREAIAYIESLPDDEVPSSSDPLPPPLPEA